MPFFAKDLAVAIYAQCTCGCSCTSTEVCTCGGGCTTPTGAPAAGCATAAQELGALREQLLQRSSPGR